MELPDRKILVKAAEDVGTWFDRFSSERKEALNRRDDMEKSVLQRRRNWWHGRTTKGVLIWARQLDGEVLTHTAINAKVEGAAWQNGGIALRTPNYEGGARWHCHRRAETKGTRCSA